MKSGTRAKKIEKWNTIGDIVLSILSVEREREGKVGSKVEEKQDSIVGSLNSLHGT